MIMVSNPVGLYDRLKEWKIVSKNYPAVILVSVALLLNGCAASSSLSGTKNLGVTDVVDVPGSYLGKSLSSGIDGGVSGQDGNEAEAEGRETITLTRAGKSQLIKPLSWQAKAKDAAKLSVDQFSTQKKLSVSAEKLPLTDFIHYIFGDLLKTNYVIDDSLEPTDPSPSDMVTLSIAEAITERELFRLVSEVLLKRDIQVQFGNGSFFLHRQSGSTDAVPPIIAIGGELSDVPDTVQTIMQVVPLKFGVKISIERTLRQLTKAKITPDFTQSAVYIEGRRDEVIRALELVELLDTPAMRGRHIGLIELDFLDPKRFAQSVVTLLENEGIDAAVGRPNNKNVVLVPLEQIGGLAVFATNEFLLDRVRYWAQLNDVPGDGPNKQYFIYYPRFARALDLEESISALLDLGGSLGNAEATSSSTGNAPSAQRSAGSVSGEISLIVDEKANVLVFYTAGQRYLTLQPLLRKLDVMPKQVMLDITIAEVSMKDEFKHGVEWALSQGEVNLTTQGAFGALNIGGIGLVVNGNDGPLTANFLTTNSLVKILSQPTLMVRDGVTASIDVGSTISVVGATTQDPIDGTRQTTASEYRKTGVSVSVKPTVNTAGIVVMEIAQNISNSVPGSSGASGNPDIFERRIKTEVLARSGQTVMLGGLISESVAAGGSGTPGLAKIPFLGNLFKSKSESTDRTELIMLVTPRVVANLSNWEPVMEAFREGLQYMRIGEQGS